MKTCPKCRKKRNLESFSIRKDGRPAGICKKCVAENTQRWRDSRSPEEKKLISLANLEWEKNNPERVKAYRAKRRYGLTFEEFDNLPKQCAICGNNTDLVIDHDHKTGNFRGVLCRRCNLGLGHFNDNPALLLKAVDYLLDVLTPEILKLMRQMTGISSK